ncbi:2,3,4,5-tetrahydropyridine-2,6-dicarboxylate N-acetyltransferase [uncultured archaeon]|nr:2,3,4,5-tetrahydropyridine-2,6-dicarboxylate N-acetyltransferase [uncultured archaeon]
MRRVISHKPLGKGNSLLHWHRAVNPLRVFWNYIWIYGARCMTSLTIKRVMYRMTGAKIGNGVSVGLDAVLDIFFPGLISIGDNTIIGFNTVILGHEFMTKEWRTGKVEIGKNVTIGANCTILPGVRIGDGATVSAMSLVNGDVPAGAFVGGIPIRELKRKAR